MNKIEIYSEINKPPNEKKTELIKFLFEQLENFGDAKEDIEKAMNYALHESQSFGGFILESLHENKTSGVVVVNQTGMDGYIPENILVYIATHKDLRGKGIGKNLMLKAMETAKGDIALHVEPNNPARFLYEKIGFKSKYLEMRFIKQK